MSVYGCQVMKLIYLHVSLFGAPNEIRVSFWSVFIQIEIK